MSSVFKQESGIANNLFRPLWLIVAIFIYSGSMALSNFLIIKPQLKRYQLLKAQKNELDEMIANTNFKDIDGTLKTLENTIDFYKDQQKLFDTRVLPRNDISIVLGELNQIVESSKLTLRYIDPLPPAGKILKKYRKIPVALQLNGTYQNFLSFLNNLEQSKYWLLIDNFTINPAAKGNDYSYNVNIYTITN